MPDVSARSARTVATVVMNARRAFRNMFRYLTRIGEALTKVLTISRHASGFSLVAPVPGTTRRLGLDRFTCFW